MVSANLANNYHKKAKHLLFLYRPRAYSTEVIIRSNSSAVRCKWNCPL